MEHHSEAFVALDTAKLRNAVAIADAGRSGEIRYLGEFDNTEVATRKLVAQLASKHTRLTFCCRPDRIRSLPAHQKPRP